ncbi:hypothetical protein BJ546DRAFT_120613 [Cryomyces antarcticus]|nr:hypothetical protein LTR39_001970 [Cryomyces antarcticus]
MSHIILTGATGTAGSAILSYCLSSPLVNRVSVLSRRPVKLAEGHGKANVIVHEDYDIYPPEVLQQMKGATGCIWAQGISSVGMKESDYTKITYDYPVAAAKAFATLSDHMNFVYISGEGADPTEKSYQMFGRIKGRAEAALLKLPAAHPSLQVYNVRPAFIAPGANYLGDRPRGIVEKMADYLTPVLQKCAPSFVSPTDKLAAVLVDLAAGDGEPVEEGPGVEANGRTLRNVALRRLAGI